MRLHLKRNGVIDGKRFSLGDKTQPSEQRGLSVGGWGRDDFCTVLISKCICKFTHTRLLIALFHLPWFLQGPTRKKGLLANYAMRLKGTNEMLETESGGGYTTFFTALLEIRKGETPQSFQPQPSRNMLMLKFYSAGHNSAIHLSTQALKGLRGSLLDLTKDPKSYISCFA